MSVYEKYPEFINTDPRVTRPKLYQVNSDFMLKKHECLFRGISLKDKTVLDLGSCVGSLGAWTLENECKFYCGVEYSKELSDLSTSNFSKYFEKDKFEIINSSVEHYLETNNQKFDIVVAGGIVHAYYDPIPFLNKLTDIADVIIIEEYHPYNDILKNQMPPMLKNYPLWKKFIATESFIQYVRVPMIWGTGRDNIAYNGSLPSIGFLTYHMNIFGFDYDPSLNWDLGQNIPDIYNINHRYGVRYFKNLEKQKQSTGFLSATNSPDSKIISWDLL